MPRVTDTQTNFTAGEISPKCYGRTDVSRYKNGAEALENCLVNIHGGVQRRPGSRHVGFVADSNKRSRLVPYIFSTTQAYVLEFGDFYIRFFVQSGGQILSGGVPYTVATPYSQAMLSELDFTQGADTMFIFHQNVPIHTLRRYAADYWVLAPAPISVAPFDELGHRFNTNLVISNATVGDARTFTAGAGVFVSADVGRPISYQSGFAIIVGFVSAVQVTADIKSAFPSVNAPANTWVLEGSPQGELVPSAKDPVGLGINLNFAASIATEPAIAITAIAHDGITTVTVQSVGHGYATGNTIVIDGCEPVGYNVTRAINVIDADTFTYALTSDPGLATVLGTAARRVSTGGIAGWRGEDVGKFVRINGGLVQVVQVISATQAIAIIRSELTSTIGAPANAWTLESAVWNEFSGYPRSGALYEQRLVAAGSPGYPQTVWGSRSGLFFDFTLGTIDDDAFSFSLPSTGQLNPITRLCSSSALLPMTYGGEYTMMGGVEKPLTPTNVQAKPRSAFGCNAVKPVPVGKELMFVQRSGRKVRSLAYDSEVGQYAAPDLTVLAEHITESGIVDMAYQQEPRSILWCVRADGKLAALTIDRDEGVIAWTLISSPNSFYESIACIPNATGDEVWVVVRRMIGEGHQRYIERFDDTLLTDNAITGTSVGGAAVWTGLGYIEALQVDVKADGVYMGRFPVVGGQIELPRDAYEVEIGLPFATRVKLLRPELMTNEGSSQGNNMRTHEVALLLQDTVGCKINGEELSFREFGDELLDKPPPEFSGIERLGTTGWMRGESPIEIIQDEPFPLHLLAVIRKFTVNS
jgi:hypothetical protein